MTGQIVWPADRRSLEGTYGIYGPFDKRAIVALAESMSLPSFTTNEGIFGC